ncbi:MAG: four helix bundle protein [Bacteroidales bacterium]|nr:four helix bundle protein [Bacteroidales bacterium]MCL2133896.1 four helix bundle protein [Bacteroidales bacterium]
MEKRKQADNVIVRLSFQFALDIIEFTDILTSINKFVIANQLLKSGTSIGANIKEAQNSESKADFIHKMKIAAKEAEETEYWLLLCKFAPSYPTSDALLGKVIELEKILNKIISSAKKN